MRCRGDGDQEDHFEMAEAKGASCASGSRVNASRGDGSGSTRDQMRWVDAR